MLFTTRLPTQSKSSLVYFLIEKLQALETELTDIFRIKGTWIAVRGRPDEFEKSFASVCLHFEQAAVHHSTANVCRICVTNFLEPVSQLRGTPKLRDQLREIPWTTASVGIHPSRTCPTADQLFDRGERHVSKQGVLILAIRCIASLYEPRGGRSRSYCYTMQNAVTGRNFLRLVNGSLEEIRQARKMKVNSSRPGAQTRHLVLDTRCGYVLYDSYGRAPYGEH